jgi:RNA polymerase sigma factor (sigma-70 family)
MNSSHSSSAPPPSQPGGSTRSLEAFCQRWLSYQPLLLQQARRLLGNESADAEDAVSTTLLRALQYLQSTATPILDERAWLGRILYSACMDMHRYRRRFVQPPPQEAEAPAESPDGSAAPSPEESLLAHEQTLALRTRIQALPPRLRDPFVMRFQQGMSYAEIADRLMLTNCNARKRIQLAYAALRRPGDDGLEE